MGLDILLLILEFVVIGMVADVNRRLASLERRLLNDETHSEQRRLAADDRRFRRRA